MIPALGRAFDLGMLYDRRSDTLIPGMTLWSPDHLKRAINTVKKPYTNSEVFIENKIEDKTSALNIEASLKLSFYGGLVNVQGAAKYLDDKKTSTHQSRVVLKYETTTELKHLTMEHLGKGKFDHPDVLDQVNATDVVVGILYGANAFMIFDKKVSKEENMKEVHGEMEVLVNALPGISIDGRGSVDITEEQKQNSENIQCKMYGDFRTDESPTNYEDAVKIYKRLPSMIGTNGESAVPIEVYLCSLSEIDNKAQKMVREISSNLVDQTSAVFEQIEWIEAECNDLMSGHACSCFPRVKTQLVSFRNNVNRFKNFFQEKLLPVLPAIRGGGEEESMLSRILQENECSPFSQSLMQVWIENKKKEIKVLQGAIKSLAETPFVTPEDVENEVYDPSNEHIACCTFRIATEEDAHILNMNEYLKKNKVLEIECDASQWTNDAKIKKKLRKTLKDFQELKDANEKTKAVKFLATDEPLPVDLGVNLGAFIKLYEDGELVDEDFMTSPKPSTPEVIKSTADAMELSWNHPNSSENNIRIYKVEYKPKSDTSDAGTSQDIDVASGNKAKHTATISGLQPATPYQFRVCAVGKIIVSPYSDTLSATTKPTSPPGKPYLLSAKQDAITIGYSKPIYVGNGVIIEKYKIEWCNDGEWKKENIHLTDFQSLTTTITGLQEEVSYEFRATPICGNAEEGETSQPSDPVKTILPPAEFDSSKILSFCDIVEEPEDGKPAVYGLPLTLIYEEPSHNLRKYEVNLEEKKTSIDIRSEKVIMVVGSTGSGKTTTMNAMINHILGVKWKDNYRFKLICEASSNQGTETIGDQAYSQTQYVTCYTIHHIEGLKMPYTLTLVDTPGFGDTRGIEQDKKITEQIRVFFNAKGLVGIDHVDAICFLAQAGNPRLTPTQQYVFDRILSMFGKDIKENICLLFTFADGQKPQALSAMRAAGIIDEGGSFYKFNNSALVVDNSGDDDEEDFNKMFWRMGIKSFEKFFEGMASMKSKSLVLTKQVLDERAQMETRVSGLREKISLGINTLSRLQQEKIIFNQRAADINANKSFKYSVTDEVRVQERLPSGTFTTNCNVCNFTCHYPCGIPRSEDKSGCASMTNDNCVVCPGKCHWSQHVNDQYRVVLENKVVEKEYSNIKSKYHDAVEGKSRVEVEIGKLQDEFDNTQNIVLNFVSEMQRGLKKLSEIALKRDPLQQVDYLDMVIQSEISQARPGWKQRVESLKETRKRAEDINRMSRPGYDPWKDYRENEETRQFLQKRVPQKKPGIVRRTIVSIGNAYSSLTSS